MCTYYIFFIRSSIIGHLGYFHILAIIHMLQWNEIVDIY